MTKALLLSSEYAVDRAGAAYWHGLDVELRASQRHSFQTDFRSLRGQLARLRVSALSLNVPPVRRRYSMQSC